MFAKPINDTILERFSCRSFDGQAIAADTLAALQAFIQALPPGPFGTSHRFSLLSAQADDASMLKGLGTYGFIQGFSAFVVGVRQDGERDLEDFGYQMELIVLKLTELGLGSCWLGGTFNRGRFSKALGLSGRNGGTIPAVLAIGNIDASKDPRNGKLRTAVGGGSRKPWAELFFHDSLDLPLAEDEVGDWTVALEALRVAPSASNKQPWRLVRTGTVARPAWHLYLQRTPGYSRSFLARLVSIEDLQRADMGIAMAHFALVARAEGKVGSWKRQDPGLVTGQPLTEYSASWA